MVEYHTIELIVISLKENLISKEYSKENYRIKILKLGKLIMKTFFFENTGNDYKLGKLNFCFNFYVKICALYTQDKRGNFNILIRVRKEHSD